MHSLQFWFLPQYQKAATTSTCCPHYQPHAPHRTSPTVPLCRPPQRRAATATIHRAIAHPSMGHSHDLAPRFSAPSTIDAVSLAAPDQTSLITDEMRRPPTLTCCRVLHGWRLEGLRFAAHHRPSCRCRSTFIDDITVYVVGSVNLFVHATAVGCPTPIMIKEAKPSPNNAVGEHKTQLNGACLPAKPNALRGVSLPS